MHVVSSLAQNIDGVLEIALPQCRRAIDEACICDGFLKCRKELGRCKDGGCVHSAARLMKWQRIVGHNAQIGEAKVDHCARNGTDVQDIARADEDDGEPVQ